MKNEILDKTLSTIREVLDDVRNLQNDNTEIERQPISDKLNILFVELKNAGAKLEEPAKEIVTQGTTEVADPIIANPITEIHQTAAENPQIAPEVPVAEPKGITETPKSSAQKPQAAKSDEKGTTVSKSTSKVAAPKK